MAKEENITTKYNLDVSGFKKGISEANKSMKEANAEFKLATAGMDDWSKSSEGVNAKLNQLDSVLVQQNKKLQIYRNQLQATNDAQAENSKRADELRLKMSQLVSQGVSPTSEEYKQYQKALNDVEKEQAKNEKSANDLKTTLMNQEAAIRRTEKEQAQYQQTLKEVQQAEKQSAKTGQTVESALEDIKNESKKANDELKNLSSQLAGGIKKGFQIGAGAVTGFVTSLVASSEATQDHIEDMGKLQTAYETAHYSFEIGKKTYEDFVGILGETDQSVEAVNHLAKLTNNTEELARWTDIAAGVYATFGDSLPLEGLTEAANETAKVSLVTGPFADALNWATMSMEDWNSVLASNPAALKAFTDSINEGLSVEDAFNAALLKMNTEQERSTIITNTLTKLYGEAGKTYQSVNKDLIEARKAQADLTDANAQMGRVVTPIVSKVKKAFANFLREITPEIKEFIDDSDWEKFGDNAENALDSIGDGAKWLIDNIDGVTKAAKLMFAALVAKKITDFGKSVSNTTKSISTMAKNIKGLANGTLIINAQTGAIIANTAATNSGTTATRLFNAAWKANPLGLVISTVSVLVSGLGLLVNKIKESNKVTDENLIKSQKIKKEYQNLNKEIKENTKSRRENMQSARDEASNADFLYERLMNLNDIQGKTNAQKDEMVRLVSELNELIPELNLKYDEETDKLNMSTEAIKKNIDAQKDLALAKAAQKNLNSIAEDIIKTENNLANATKERTNLEKSLTEATKNRLEFERKYGKDITLMSASQHKQYEELLLAENNAKKAYEDSDKTVKEYSKTLKDLNNTYDQTAFKANKYLDKADISKGLANIVQLAKEAGRDIPQAISDGINNGIYAIPESINQLDSLISFDDALSKAGLQGKQIPTYISQGLMNGQITLKDAIAQVNEVLTLADKAQQYIDEGKAIPKNLAKGIKDGTYSIDEANAIMDASVNFYDLKEKANEAGATIPKNLSKQIKNGKISIDEANKLIQDSITFNEVIKKANEEGIKIPKSLANGIRTGELEPKVAADRVQALINYTKMINDAGLSGVEIPNKIRNGILSGEIPITDATNQMNRWIQFQTALTTAGLSGADIPKKMRNGILSGKVDIEDAILQLNNAAQNEASKGPDKLKPEGEKTGKAYTDGVSSKKPDSKKAGEDLIDGAKDGVENEKKQNTVFSAIANFGSKLLRKLRESLDEHSPSDASNQFGQWLLEGLGLGVEKKEKTVLKQISSFGKNVLDTLKNELSQNVGVQDMIDNVKSSLTKARNVVSNLTVPQLKSNGIRNSTGNLSSNTIINNNYQQVINSPKAPSRREIYRDTRNLLNLVKGGN